MSPHSEQPEAIKPRPDYPPKTPPPPKKPPSPPTPDPPRSEHVHLLDGLPVPQRAGGHRNLVLMKNRPGTSWTLENAPWVPQKAAGQVADRLTAWGFTPPDRLPDIVKSLVKAVLADGGRRVSVHLSEEHGRVLVLALSHQAASEDKGHELLTAVHDLGAASCGTETTVQGRQVWALLDLNPV